MTLGRYAFLLPLLALAACDGRKQEKVDPRPQPVLEGTVSDAMLQTEQMQAEAPYAEPLPTGTPGLDAEPGEEASPPSSPPARRAPRPERTRPRAGADNGDGDDARRPAPAATRSPASEAAPSPAASPAKGARPSPTASPRATPTG